MRGIILAAGSGTRLYPLTLSVSKQLLPVYDKPMIYYPLSTLMSFGIRDILIITTIQDEYLFKRLLGDGSDLGCKINYEVQESPNGLAEAFIIGEKFIGEENVCLILGDNIFFGIDTIEVKKNIQDFSGGLIFAYQVNDPERYGVVSFDENKNVIDIQEKPETPKSSYAVPGLYFYDNSVVEVAKKINPSNRGELEITDVNKFYLENKKLKVQILKRGVAWLDTGTFESLSQAGSFVQSIEDRQGLKIGCIEEISYNNGWINKEKILEVSLKYNKNNYGKYLKRITEYYY